MPKPTGAQILGALLRAGGRGLSTYYDQKQLAEQRELRKKDRERVNLLFKQGQADRQGKLDAIKQEGIDQSLLNSMIRQLDAPFGMSVPFPGGGAGVEVTRPPSDLPEFSGLYSDIGTAYRKVYGKEPPASLQGKPMPTAGELVKTQQARETAKLALAGKRLDVAAKKKAATALPKDTRSDYAKAVEDYIALSIKGETNWTPEDRLRYQVSKDRALRASKTANPISLQNMVMNNLKLQYGEEWNLFTHGERVTLTNVAGRQALMEDWVDVGSAGLKYFKSAQ